MKISILILLPVLAGLSLACGTVKRGTVPWEEKTTTKKPDSTTEAPATLTAVEHTFSSSGDSRSVKKIKEQLQRAFKDWQGIPYVLGGTGYDGVDCSAFMQIVFEDYFAKKIPRSTREQFGAGKKVRKRSVRPGDMVFFKTGRKSFHVGVMVNDTEFLHASVSSGVMISNLESSYWEQRYYTARRVL